ncbi:MAG: GNAT family N-acetyltransferase [Chloroflexota bacterium]
MENRFEIITVDATNVAEQGFFCYKSKPKSVGYQRKLNWLEQRFSEGMRIKILYEGDRSMGFVEYIPGEFAWRSVNARGYMVIHCLWIVGRGKGKGYGSRLLAECVEDARSLGQHGVAMVTSNRVWLAYKKILLKNGFESVDEAPPFELLVKRFDESPLPSFPRNWDERLNHCGSGLTVFRADQCPYIEDTVKEVLEIASERGIETRVIELTSGWEVQDSAPSPYGVFSIVYNGELVSYHYLGKKEKKRLIDLLDAG